jgi:Glycosyl transferase family 2
MFMKKCPLISVIVIFLNGEKFIRAAIESIVEQKYSNWELLLVDDGSTDGSSAIALEYARKNPQKIRYLEHENHVNKGMSATRNLGIQHAQGEWIAFLDADDVWLPENLERLVTLAACHQEAGMIYGSTLYWYTWTGEKETQPDFSDDVGLLTGQPNTLFAPPALLRIFLENGGAVPCMCSLIVRRELLIETGGFETTFPGLYEDQVFYAKIALKAPIFVTNEWGAKYRQHGESCCAIAQSTGAENQARIVFLNWLKKYLLAQGNQDTALMQALESQLWICYHPRLDKLKQWVQSFSENIKEKIRSIVKQIF